MEDLMGVMLEKKDGVTRTLEMSEEKGKELRESEDHLCWTCSNYENCDKVKDEHKKTIDKYDFITDGVQLIDESGNVDTFFVEGCNTYIRDKANVRPGIEGIQKRQKLMNHYFGTEDVKDARKIMEEIEKRDIAAGRKR